MFIYHGSKDHFFNMPNTDLTYKYLKDTFSENMTMTIEEDHGHSISMVEFEALRVWLH